MTANPRRALITGASSGIGQEFAHQLSTHCDEIIVTGRRQERLHQLVGTLRSQGIKADALPADLNSTIGIAKLVETIRQRGPLRYLVNNAGFSTLGPFTEQQPASQEAMIGVHIQATMQLTLAALAGMQQTGCGYVINVSSLVSLAPFGGLAVYGGTKAFINNFSAALQQEVAAQHIKIQCLCPGYTRTEFHEHAAFDQFDSHSVPDELWLDPDQVVRESLTALHGASEQVMVVPGAKNQAITRKILQKQLEASGH